MFQATTWYLKCMKAIGNDRSFNPGLWDEALWEMFSATYELAMEKHRVSYAKTVSVPLRSNLISSRLLDQQHLFDDVL